MRSVLLVLVVAGLVGCSDPLSPRDLVGDWKEETPVVGASFVMSLTENRSSISGSGNSCGELLPCTSFTVSGMVADDEVRLDFTYRNGRIERFVGRPTFEGLRGVMFDTAPSVLLEIPRPVVFRRTILISFV